MIERLNFYDVYGYLFPGLALLGLIWFPTALAGIALPIGDAVALALSILLGYILGHLIQIVGSGAFPSKINGKYPSNTFLDTDERNLPTAIKVKIRELVQAQFGIDVTTLNDVDGESLDTRRETAFRMCRTAVLYSTTRSYAEQFQAMYVFTRGICAATVLGGLFHLGCAVGVATTPRLRSSLGWVTAILFATTVALAFASSLEIHASHWVGKRLATLRRTGQLARFTFWIIAVEFFAVGAIVAIPKLQLFPSGLGTLLTGGAVSLLVARLFWLEYRRYASLFAGTVYRDFVTLMASSAMKK